LRGELAGQPAGAPRVVGGRIERRANSFRARPIPIAVPTRIAAANENASRISVLRAASGIEPSLMPTTNRSPTSTGRGIAAHDLTREMP